MKAISKSAIHAALMGLGFAVVLVVPIWAQFEVDPDHYESPAAVTAPQPRMAVSVQSKAAAPAILPLREGRRQAELYLVAAPDSSRAVQQKDSVKLGDGGLVATLRRAVHHLGQKLSRWAAMGEQI